MEAIAEGVNSLNIADSSAKTVIVKENRIQVSNTKKPLFFYVNLAKRFMQQHNEVELSALGMGYNVSVYQTLLIKRNNKDFGPQNNNAEAIATVVTIAEILKNNGLVVEKKILTSTIDMREDASGRSTQKAKIEILLGKSEKFDELMAATADEVAEYEEQS